MELKILLTDLHTFKPGIADVQPQIPLARPDHIIDSESSVDLSKEVHLCPWYSLPDKGLDNHYQSNGLKKWRDTGVLNPLHRSILVHFALLWVRAAASTP